MDEYRTSIFNDETRSPTYLWTKIFHIDGTLIANAGGVDGGGFGIADGSTIAAFGNAQLVYRESALLGYLFVQLCGTCGRVDGDAVR